MAGKKPNACGLYDMLGNASAWGWDVLKYTAFDSEGEWWPPISGGTSLGDYGLERTVP